MNERDLLRSWAERILENDQELAERIDKLRDLASNEQLQPTVKAVQERVGGFESRGPDAQLGFETIVHRVGRPVLEVADDDYIIEGPEAAIWETRLSHSKVRTALRRIIPSVGRVEVSHHPDFEWVGTAWMIADDVVVTNRHVATEFAMRNDGISGPPLIFRRGWPDRNQRMTSQIDFRRELRKTKPRAFDILDILHIEDDDGFDFAFLKIKRTGTAGSVSSPISPSKEKAAAKQYIATVGYPAADSRIPEADLMNRLFSDKYNFKRLAPGQVMSFSNELVLHDCTTLGGNSGSPIVDLESGDVVGLHFSGIFARENRGVPIGYVFGQLSKLGKRRSTRDEQRPSSDADGSPSDVPTGPLAPSDLPVAQAVVSFTIPLQISVSLGQATVAGTSVGGGSETGGITVGSQVGQSWVASAAAAASVEAAVSAVRERLAGRGDVLIVRDGYVFRDGWITSDPAIVVILNSEPATLEAIGLPSRVGAFPIEVRSADPWDVAEAQAKLEILEGIPATSYKEPQDFELEEVHETMSVTCHVSPDAGWPTLREFLSETDSRLTIGMYDFTAPHIVDGVLDAVRDEPKKLKLVLQEGAAMSGKPNDIEEHVTIKNYSKKLGSRFEHVPASIGNNRQFASSYHIKVAVRDGKAFWLSSGNWQSSNQPDHEVAIGEKSWDLLLNHNREWHVVIENSNLAKQFEKYIRYDFNNAKAEAEEEAVPPPELFFVFDEADEERRPSGTPRYFKPLVINRKVRVMPLLTPDNYCAQSLKLIKSAKKRLLFQNQSLNVLGQDKHGNDKNDERFVKLVDALLEQQQNGVDVRIIMRGEYAPVAPLEQLQKRGFDMSKVRLQNRCHTKGIIVDSSKVLVGSHNWTNQGTLANRDASLIVDDDEIAEYFEDIFWFDWKNLTRQSVGPRRVRRFSDDESISASAGPGTRVVSWQEIVYGD